jgi:quinol monooxygenase YgiN
MVLATARVDDFDRFWDTFSTMGAAKRGQHGSKGASVFRDPNDEGRYWVVFDWDEQGWQSFISDPETPAIFQEAGMDGRPQAATFVRSHDF